MPNPFWREQSLQHAVYADHAKGGAAATVQRLQLTNRGTQRAAELDHTVHDMSTVLEYAGEPAALKRQGIGVWVILFLSFLTLLAWLMKNEYWRDVH